MKAAIHKKDLDTIEGTTPRQVLEDVRSMKEEARDGRMITPEERKSLELRLHRMLIWVGIMTPFEFELGDKKVPLHDIVWDLLAKECMTEEEKDWIGKLIKKLTRHAKVNEDILHNNELTVKEAHEIYEETAGLMRAIMSLKSLVGGKNFCNIRQSANRRRIEDAQYWLGFLKQIT